MSLPIFFQEGEFHVAELVQLNEDTARHVVQVLRMSIGNKLQLTNGNGYCFDAQIVGAEKKKCQVIIEKVHFVAPKKNGLHLAVAFTKNASRNEWLLEKATELGVSSIIPIIATRTEREKFRLDRWNGILTAAILQSQQYYLPTLHEPTLFKKIMEKFNAVPQKLIGHCMDSIERNTLATSMKSNMETICMIGPEGDFTNEEVTLAMEKGFTGILLGEQRLRTETAAMTVCAFHNLINYEA